MRGAQRSRGRRRAGLGPAIGLMVAALLVAAAPAAGAGERIGDRFAAANRCLTVATGAGFVAAAADGYRVTRDRAQAEPFFFEPTGLGRYLLYDSGRRLLAAGGGAAIERTAAPGRRAEWALRRATPRWFRIKLVHGPGRLAVAGRDSLIRGAGAGRAGRFRLVPTHGCSRYPDPSPGASGEPGPSVNPDGTVRGFVDTHLHITADMRAGGRVIDGKAYDRYGVTRALGRDDRNHGPDGSADVTGNLLRTGLPFGTHGIHGWPTFTGWPVHDTNTHQQTYFRWLERMWMAGERIVVAQTIEDEPLCRIEPARAHSCDEEQTIALEVRRLRGLQRYVDAQSGGPGKGWFRIVSGPEQARRVVERGKLAVVIGAEWSNPLGCSERADCTRADVDRGIARLRKLGVRSTFIAHWVDNGFAGAALEGGTKGTFINVFNAFQNGRYLRSGPCPHPSQGEEISTLSPLEMQILSQFFPATQGLEPMPDYPPGRQCNRKGLTKLGAYFVRRLIGQSHADRGRPHERAGTRASSEDRRPARLSARLQPHRHRRKLDGRRASQPLPERRRSPPQHPPTRPGWPRRSSASATSVTAVATSASGSAPTPAASPPSPARRRRTGSTTRSVATAAMSASAVSGPASAPSTSMRTGSPTTGSSPTS